MSSKIEGLGLFAVEDIRPGTDLGISHVSDNRFENGWIRTPLGGFVNHSAKPNCIVIFDETQMTYNLKVQANIKAGDELTLCYNLYSVDQDGI